MPDVDSKSAKTDPEEAIDVSSMDQDKLQLVMPWLRNLGAGSTHWSMLGFGNVHDKNWNGCGYPRPCALGHDFVGKGCKAGLR